MISVEIPSTPFLIIEVIVGIIVGIINKDFPKVIAWLTAVGFILGIFVFAFSNPTALNDLNVATNKIEFIMIAFVNMLLHSVFFDIGAGIVEAIRHPRSR